MAKVLLVEDEKFLRDLITQKLLQEGYEVVEAEDGEEGIRKAEEEKPDLILLDLILPKLDGFEALERMKKQREIAGIPVVILSNLGGTEDVTKGLKLGAIDFLVKAEHTPGEVVTKIREVLQQ